MFCRACNTRLEDAQRHCPNCGRAARLSLPGDPARPPVHRRPASLAQAQLPPPAELELYDEVDLERTHADSAANTTGRPAPPLSASGRTSFALDPVALRERLAVQPDLLEPGLSVLTDQSGRPIGAGYTTDVGEIDVLARDSNGRFVVVIVADKDPGRDPVADVLQRIGWVRKHLGGGLTDVRGIVVVEPPFRDLSYAAAAVAGTVSFKTSRIALTFEDVDL